MNKLDIYHTFISIITFKEVLNVIVHNNEEQAKYVCLTDINVLVDSFKNEKLRNALNSAFLNLPDGKSIELYSRLKGVKHLKTISGYWLLLELLKTNKRHVFYGANSEKLLKIKLFVEKQYPNAHVLEYKEPPIIDITNIKENNRIKLDIVEINKLNPDVVWIGVGGVKQDILMHEYCKYLDAAFMIGVGAVFDYISGDVKKSPEWIKKIYLRWLYRAIFSPNKEKTKRQLKNMAIFLYKILKNG